MPVQLQADPAPSLVEHRCPPADLRKGAWNSWAVLLALIAAYVVLFWYLYPPLPGIEDEVGFINQGVLFSHGHVSAEGGGYPDLFDFRLEHGRHVTKRNPGISLLLVPFLWLFGAKSVFWSGALVHIAVTLATALILGRKELSVLWAALVLLHPTFTIYSRTVTGGEGAALGLLLAFLAVVACRRPGWWAGVAVGLAAVMRYYAGAVLPFLALAIAATAEVENRRREALKCLAAGGICGIGVFAYNYFVYGTILGHSEIFNPRAFPAQLCMFTAGLMAIWPGMLCAPFLDRSRECWAVQGLIWPIVAIFLPYGFFDRGSNWIETLVLSQRLLLPALGVWIVCYSGVMQGRLRQFWSRLTPAARKTSAAAALIAALLGNCAVFAAHQRHLQRLQDVQTEIRQLVRPESTIVANTTVAKLFGLAWQSNLYHVVAFSETQRFTSENDLKLEGKDFFLAVLPKRSPNEFAQDLEGVIRHYGMRRILTHEPGLLLYESSTGPAQAAPVENAMKSVRDANGRGGHD